MGTVEWEGRVRRVACHPPYILLFDSRFIEIRHVATSHLVQIIFGNDIRCIWDGRGTNRSQTISETPWDGVVSEEPRVHGVMSVESPQPDRRGVTTQQVFELVPTAPSYPAGSSLASPLLESVKFVVPFANAEPTLPPVNDPDIPARSKGNLGHPTALAHGVPERA